jgi:hypothetical protein
VDVVDAKEPTVTFATEVEDVDCEAPVELECEASRLSRVNDVGCDGATSGLLTSNANSPSADMGDGVSA